MMVPHCDVGGFLGGGQAALTLINVSQREKMEEGNNPLCLLE